MAAFNAVQMLTQVQDNLVRLLLLVTIQCNNPSQANLDAISTAYNAAQTAGTAAAGIVIPKPNYSLDGESYSWDSYRQGLEKSVTEVQRLIVMMGGNFLLRSQGQV